MLVRFTPVKCIAECAKSTPKGTADLVAALTSLNWKIPHKVLYLHMLRLLSINNHWCYRSTWTTNGMAKYDKKTEPAVVQLNWVDVTFSTTEKGPSCEATRRPISNRYMSDLCYATVTRQGQTKVMRVLPQSSNNADIFWVRRLKKNDPTCSTHFLFQRHFFLWWGEKKLLHFAKFNDIKRVTRFPRFSTAHPQLGISVGPIEWWLSLHSQTPLPLARFIQASLTFVPLIGWSIARQPGCG